MPLYAGGVCRVCQNSSYYFDLGVQSCQLCPNGMSAATNNNTCMCFYSQISVNNQCMCPTNLPFLSTTGCIACYLPNYFNATTR
jgi:hypothetical protein